MTQTSSESITEAPSHASAQGQKRHIIRNRVSFLEQKVPGYASVLGIFSLLLLWELICRLGLVPPLFLPAPSLILLAGWDMLSSGELHQNILASMSRIVIGYGIGAVCGIVIGLILGFSRWVDAVLSPIVYSIYPIPKIALLPLIILWLGIGEAPKFTMIALGVFFPVVINTFSGVKNVDPIWIKAAVTFGASHLSVIRKVILPGALPMIFAGLKLAAGTSLLLLVSAEMIAAQQGIGSMILHYGNLMITTKLMVGVLILSLLGLFFNRGLQWLEGKLLPWK
ncbi:MULTISPECIES: ABC transporter permease [unclassified Paenibacillus]|uniref:ABC transporter permease n=1 Tax=unclassified Paenibacillus TaxID=185978 RepID=UPI001AEB87AA|nr:MULTISPECIES: ABC transporter permease [unclassified Paenibacillus]MBP1157256.1 NitT/TauT family transport system permease protein [Paenibacillus sp. PvP091]MBP1172005.1 NitT/TauT family transport system permease protein [Paenibacillus sp. PvR098]MBP2438386.1 NitT/TauT family transport system permease protein [Paenibacillus sp. PvP052]